MKDNYCIYCLMLAITFLSACATRAVVPLSSMIKASELSDIEKARSASISNPDFTTISNAALAVSESTSAAKSTVEERKQALEVLRWDARPRLVPSARLDTNPQSVGGDPDDTSSSYRLALQQPFLDFGRHASLSKQAKMDVSLAQIEHWQERNLAVHDALEHYVEYLRYRDLAELSKTYIEKHVELEKNIKDRVNGGVADRSELSLIEIRLKELVHQAQNDQRKQEAAWQEFNDQTDLSRDSIQNIIEEMIFEVILPEDSVHASPSVLWAQQSLQQARENRKEVKSGSMPSVVLEAYLANNSEDTSKGLALSLESSSFAGFAFRSHLKSADAEIHTARTALAKAIEDYDRESRRISLVHSDLVASKASLVEQSAQTQQAVTLFFEQFQSGVKPIMNAISVYESDLDIMRQLVSAQADIRLNKIRKANLMGVIAPFPAP